MRLILDIAEHSDPRAIFRLQTVNELFEVAYDGSRNNERHRLTPSRVQLDDRLTKMYRPLVERRRAD
jgi:hypothetical protein